MKITKRNIWMTVSLFILTLSFCTFRYGALDSWLLRMLLFFAALACLFILARPDEEKLRARLKFPRFLNAIAVGLVIILINTALYHFGIEIKETQTLFKNDTFFVVFLMLAIVAMIRTLFEDNT